MISLGILPNGHLLTGGKNKRRNLLEQIFNISLQEANTIADAFMSAIGNTHRGVYCVEYKWAIVQNFQPNILQTYYEYYTST